MTYPPKNYTFNSFASPTNGEKTSIFRNLHIIDKIMKNSNEESRNYWCLILTILPLFCVFGNLAVIYVVIREKCLHTSTNLILVSLACADILVAILVMPFSIYLITNNLVWDLPAYMCDFFCAADVSASTSSIVHLVAVSIDRFYAVVKHTEYNTSKHQHRTYWIIGLCWVFSLSIALPLGIGLNEKNAPPPPFNVQFDGSGTPQKYCSIDNPYFMLSSSIFAFYIPCFVMLIMYGIVFNKLRRSLLAVRLREMAASHMISFGNSMGLLFQDNSRQKNKSKNNTNLTRQDQWWADPLLKTIENDMADQDVKEELSGDEMEELQNVVDILKQDNFENGGGGSQKSTDSRERGFPKNDSRTQRQSTADVSLKPRSTIERYFASSIVVVLRKPRAILRQRRFTQVKLIQNVRMRAIAVATKLKSKERGVIRKETRATKLVLIVMCAFLLCYLPFFTTNVVKIFKLWSNTWNDRWEHLFIVFTWLGYCNSCLNPIIYSIFNKKFRQTFFKTFGFWRRGDEEKNTSGVGRRRRCHRRHGRRRQRQLLTTTIFSPNNVTTLRSYLPRIRNTTMDDDIAKSSSNEKANSSVKVESEQKLLVVDEEPKSRVIDTRNHKRDIPVSVSFLEPHLATLSPENVVKSLPNLHNLDPNIKDEDHILRQEMPVLMVDDDISDNL